MKSRLFGMAAVAGLAVLLGGTMAAPPAHADEDDYYPRQHIRRDINDIHNDQWRLDDLYRQRDFLADRHDWRGVRRLNQQIDSLRRHIERDRHDVHRDIDRNRRNRDTDRYEHERFDHDRFDHSRFNHDQFGSDRYREGGLPD